jgi:rSAM/selenodomain-associated transferase 1
MRTIGIAIICKTPEAGKSKTRLSPPLLPHQCAGLSACFIKDLTASIQGLCDTRGYSGYAVYTPVGSETKLRQLLPDDCALIPQTSGDLGARIHHAITSILDLGHSGAIIVNADSPTLPMRLLDLAARKLMESDCVALGPSLDGGYTFVGLSQPRERLFEDIPWSTEAVHRLTLERAREIGLPVFNTDLWYDVDDAATLDILKAEIRGEAPSFASGQREPFRATATANYLASLSGDRESTLVGS